MKYRLSNYEKFIFVILDISALNVAFFFAFHLLSLSSFTFLTTEYLSIFMFVNFTWMLAAKFGYYNVDNRRISTWSVFFDFAKLLLLNALLCLAFLNLLSGNWYGSSLLQFYLIFLFTGSAARLGLRAYLKGYRRRGFNFRRIVAVGINAFSLDFVQEIVQHPEYGYKFLGFFDHSENPQYEGLRVQKFSKINDFLLEYDIDEIYISLPSEPDYSIKQLIKFCNINSIRVNFLNEFIHLLNKKTVQVKMDYNGPTPIVSVSKEPLEGLFNKIFKRGFDIVFSSLLFLTIFIWLFPILALCIKMNSKGPIFFKQHRTGMDNHTFFCYKFRTMYLNEQSDHLQATANDYRITKVGAFLRKTNLDELPQFWNVLVGDMSVVGPRPHMLSHTNMYSKLITPFMIRHWVKPGITGLAQAKGFRGETKEVRQMSNRVRMDVFYIQNWSFYFDLKIVFLTLWNMIIFQKTGG